MICEQCKNMLCRIYYLKDSKCKGWCQQLKTDVQGDDLCHCPNHDEKNETNCEKQGDNVQLLIKW